MTIKIPKKGERASWIREFEVDGNVAKYNVQTAPQTAPVNVGFQSPITIPSGTSDYWEIPSVNYRGMIGNVHILKTLLDNGNSRTQDDWAVYSENARKKGEFYVPDYPLFYSTLESACALKTSPVIEEARQKIQEFSRARWLMTLTRIKYSPNGDKIIHNQGLSDQYEISEPFVGQDGKIPAGSSDSLYQKLLGTQGSVRDIDNVFRWLNGTDTYLYRVNSTPKRLDERVAGFIAGSDWADLICGWDPTGTNSSLGVRFVRAQ